MGQESGIQDLRPRERRGIVYDKWPFRLDISVEYQDWILVGMCFLIVGLWSLPCITSRMHSKCTKDFTKWVYTRVHVFYWTIAYLSLFLVMFTIGVLPDWTVDEFGQYLELFVKWVLEHLVKAITSCTIIFGFLIVYKFRERVLVAAGMEHIRLFRWNWHDPLGLSSKRRPIEVFMWKVDGLLSSGGKMMKANDVYLECYLGDNEPMRTRVHNNAGRGCVVKESVQLNIDENCPTELLHILVKDQSLLASSEVARLVLSTAELCGIEDQTGKRRSGFTYSQEYFVPLSLSPSGQIWIAAAPVDDLDDGETQSLLEEDSIGLTC